LTKTEENEERFPIDKCIRISMFAKQLFSDEKTARHASQIMQGSIETCSPRLD
jgi:hypothetical protein